MSHRVEVYAPDGKAPIGTFPIENPGRLTGVHRIVFMPTLSPLGFEKPSSAIASTLSFVDLDVKRRSLMVDDFDARLSRVGSPVPPYAEETRDVAMMSTRYTWPALFARSLEDCETLFDHDAFEPAEIEPGLARAEEMRDQDRFLREVYADNLAPLKPADEITAAARSVSQPKKGLDFSPFEDVIATANKAIHTSNLSPSVTDSVRYMQAFQKSAEAVKRSIEEWELEAFERLLFGSSRVSPR